MAPSKLASLTCSLVIALAFGCSVDPQPMPFGRPGDGAATAETDANDGSSSGTGSMSDQPDEPGGDSGGNNGATPQSCGNAVIEGNEECDQNDFGFRTCQTYGFMAGTLTCTADCTVDTGNCYEDSICGDGMITGLEDCEPGDLAGASCDGLGLGSGELGCSSDCTFDAAACSCKGYGAPCQYNAADPSDPGGCCPAGYKGNEKGICLTIPFQTCQ